ncbi:hypothetical protein GCM10022626_30960 [[Pseudomonas] carboxydohydrogena]
MVSARTGVTAKNSNEAELATNAKRRAFPENGITFLPTSSYAFGFTQENRNIDSRRLQLDPQHIRLAGPA